MATKNPHVEKLLSFEEGKSYPTSALLAFKGKKGVSFSFDDDPEGLNTCGICIDTSATTAPCVTFQKQPEDAEWECTMVTDK